MKYLSFFALFLYFNLQVKAEDVAPTPVPTASPSQGGKPLLNMPSSTPSDMKAPKAGVMSIPLEQINNLNIYGNGMTGSKGGGLLGWSEEYSSTRENPERIDKEWFFANAGVPQVLRDILRDNVSDDIVTNHAHDLHIGCRTFLDSGLEDFITSSVSPLFSNKPGFCNSLPEKIVHENLYGGNSHLWKFELEALSGENFDDPLDKFVISKIKERVESGSDTVNIPIPESTNSSSTSSNTKTVRGNSSTKPSKEIISTGLLRLWTTLNRTQQMRLLTHCPTHLSLNTLRGFWRINSREVEGNDANYRVGLRLCQASTWEEIIPMLDKSVLSEYMLNLSTKKPFATEQIVHLCEAWPETSLATPSPFPPAGSIDQLFFNVGEHYREGLFDTTDLLGAFNPLELEGLTQEQKDALMDYTSSNYNAMNAYQMWGSLGLFFLNRDLQDASRGPNWDDLDDEEKESIRNSVNVYETGSGQTTKQAVRNLADALRQMDRFEGISFSAQKLSGHFFSSPRVGSNFTPGFFMSTSVDITIAQAFLDLQEDNEETRYLFVIDNKSGIPITNHSAFMEEQEVLVHPDSSFRVTAIEPYIHNGEEHEHIKIVYMSEN